LRGGSVELVVGYFGVDMSRPDSSVVVEPPKCEVDRDIVDGLEEGRDPDGGAVKTLVTVDRYVAPPKEAHRNKLCGSGEVVVAGGFVVDC
jgi:hypothetical protein